MERSAHAEEVVVPLQVGRDGNVAPATQIRSTLLGASILTIKEQGHFDAYLAHLSPEFHDPILNAIAGTWLDLSVALAHYRAANEIGLAPTQLMEMGRGVASRIQDSLLGTLAKLSKGIGVTPWLGLEYQPKLWARVYRGGAVAVYKLGPKEARYEAHGIPEFAKIPYFRHSLRGMFAGSGALFCNKMFVKEIPSYTARGVIGFRIAWA